MKFLVNNKELIYFLQSLIDYKKKIMDRGFYYVAHPNLDLFLRTLKPKSLEKDNRKKLKEQIARSVKNDLDTWVNNVKKTLEEFQVKDYETMHTLADKLIETLGEDKVIDLYMKSKKDGFVKSTGLHIDNEGQLIRRKRFNDHQADCLIRNTVGNEDLLINKIDKKYPFWFIDSGYTNFLEPNKKWHRLVRNHLHENKFFNAPADRLGVFKSFPERWRKEGETILIVEPGPFAAGIFHVDLKTWKYEVEKELRKYTDKKIKFREKAPRKQRTKLYDELRNEDYYCVVSINSNAATESIWAGIPAITLDKHITNAVTRNKLSDVNDLYRGQLSEWLCVLSYNQFSYQELINGTALKLYKEFHDV